MKAKRYKCSVGRTNYSFERGATGFYKFERTSSDVAAYIPEALIESLVQDRLRAILYDKVEELLAP